MDHVRGLINKYPDCRQTNEAKDDKMNDTVWNTLTLNTAVHGH